jgi:L-lactate dehydrogenase complex protein LldG
MDRTAFLARVASALSGVQAPELPPTVPPTPASGETSDPERFVAAVAANNAVARRVSLGEVADAVTDAARELGRDRRVAVAPDVAPWRAEVEQGLARAGAQIVEAGPAHWRADPNAAAMGVTSAALAVAATGSLLLIPGADSPRLISLLPPRHLAIVPVDRLVPGLEQVMPVLIEAASRSSAPVLVTAPSRTSDIEMTTVYGVHGPKVLRILLVG